MLSHASEQERRSLAEENRIMPPPQGLPPRKPKSSFTKLIPAPLPLGSHPASRSCTPDVRSFTPSIENEVFEAELVPPPSPFISVTRSYVETPRPDPIPLSPQVNSQTGVVVEVGTCRPSYEETKPFEFADALKYSAKHRRRQDAVKMLDSSGSEALPSGTTTAVVVPNLLNESFLAAAKVSDDFQEEMVEWYDENLKKATVV